jgi:rhodanese-related sulfurtransferase
MIARPPPAPHPRRREIAAALFPQLAVIGKALASPQRLMLLDLLCQGPRSVEALAAQAGLSMANTSQHLQALRAARLVETERSGQRIIYRLASDDVGNFYVTFRSLAASRLAELDRVMRDLVRPSGPVDRDGILAKIRAGEVTLLDVRPPEEFEAGHLPGALCIPVDELPERLAEVPRDREVIAYCRGPFCIMADEAVEVLREHGLEAQVLDLGPVELRSHRLRLERSPSPRREPAVKPAKRPRTESRTKTRTKTGTKTGTKTSRRRR